MRSVFVQSACSARAPSSFHVMSPLDSAREGQLRLGLAGEHEHASRAFFRPCETRHAPSSVALTEHAREKKEEKTEKKQKRLAPGAESC